MKIGVKQVGLLRKGVLLKVTIGRDMLGSLNPLSRMEWIRAV
jgi:hypothetical protein